ncbi:LysR substrate-binding domain-containing protein [Micromonospora sp. B11E3]|uniref:LysR substrate-binding domain-containing protein n=1 Tax=Micromonospora sp. B11E3 TaxID=3153562 RepID=UPI00325F4D19
MGPPHAVAAGSGPAVLSSLAVSTELPAGALVAVAVSGLSLHRQLRAVWPAGRELTGPVRDLHTIARRPIHRRSHTPP